MFAGTPDVAVVLIGFLLIGGECGDAGGVGGLDNGVKVEGYGLVGLIAEVGEVEGDAGELVVLDMPVGMCLFGESALDGGPGDGGGVLHGLEECPLWYAFVYSNGVIFQFNNSL